jgi:hypothetical protein
MPQQRGHRREVPYHNGAIRAAGSHPLAIRRKERPIRRKVNLTGMTPQGEQLLAAARVPDAGAAVCQSGENAVARRRPGDPSDDRWISG